MDKGLLIRQAKSLAAIIQGLQALNDSGISISVIERHLHPQLIKTYQRELKKIIVNLSREEASELLMAMKNINLPAQDPGLN